MGAEVRSRQGDTVDRICWEHYGRTADVVEEVLRENPGLAQMGPVLPAGTPVRLPKAPPEKDKRDTVRLWD